MLLGPQSFSNSSISDRWNAWWSLKRLTVGAFDRCNSIDYHTSLTRIGPDIRQCRIDPALQGRYCRIIRPYAAITGPNPIYLYHACRSTVWRTSWSASRRSSRPSPRSSSRPLPRCLDTKHVSTKQQKTMFFFSLLQNKFSGSRIPGRLACVVCFWGLA